MRSRQDWLGVGGQRSASERVSKDWFVSASDHPVAVRTRERRACVSASAWSSTSFVQTERTYTGVALPLGGSARAGADRKRARDTTSAMSASAIARTIRGE